MAGSRFSKGIHALSISDRSGAAFPSTGYIVVQPGADANETIKYTANNTGLSLIHI